VVGEAFEGEHTPEAIVEWARGLRRPSPVVSLGRRNWDAQVCGGGGDQLWVVDF
jgi:hypothetical protein